MRQPELGQAIRKRRYQLGLSLREFQDVSHTGLSRIELGERKPSALTLVRIADVLKTTALELATGKHGHCPFCRRG